MTDTIEGQYFKKLSEGDINTLWADIRTRADEARRTGTHPSQQKGYVSDMASQAWAGFWTAVDEAGQTVDELTPFIPQMELPIVGKGVELPKTTEAQTTPGALTKNLVQFTIGFLPALKALKIAKVGLAARPLVSAFLGGAMADFTVFDPHQPRFSNLINDLAPSLKNPLTEYLAADPNDSNAEGRFKNVVEGLGLGAVMQGAFMGIARVLKGAKTVKEVAEAEAKPKITEAPVEVKPKPFETYQPNKNIPAIDIKEVTEPPPDLQYKGMQAVGQVSYSPSQDIYYVKKTEAPGKLYEVKKGQIPIPEEAPKPGEVAPARVKMMITQADEAALRARGFTQEQINKMKPAEAGKILEQGEVAPVTPVAPPSKPQAGVATTSPITQPPQAPAEVKPPTGAGYEAKSLPGEAPLPRIRKIEAKIEEGIQKEMETMRTQIGPEAEQDVFDLMGEKGITKINTQLLRQILHPDEYKRLLKTRPGFFSNEATATPIDKVAQIMGRDKENIIESILGRKEARARATAELRSEAEKSFGMSEEGSKLYKELVELENKYAGESLSGGRPRIFSEETARQFREAEQALQSGDVARFQELTAKLNRADVQLLKNLEDFMRSEHINVEDVLHYKTASGKDVFVNMRNMRTPEGVKETITKLAKETEETIGTRTVSHEQTIQEALELGLSPEDLISVKGTVPIPRATLTAARDLLAGQSELVQRLAKEYVDTGDEKTFAELIHRYATLRSGFVNVRKALTETARSLEAAKIDITGDIIKPGITEIGNYTQEVDNLMKMFSEGKVTGREFAEKLATFTPKQIAKLATKPTKWDMLIEARVNFLLYNIPTQVVNTLSGALNVVLAPAERYLAYKFNWAVANPEVVSGEASAMVSGYINGFTSIVKLVGQTMREEAKLGPRNLLRRVGSTILAPSRQLEDIALQLKALRYTMGDDVTKLELKHQRAITAENLGLTGIWGQAIDVLGEYIRLPGRLATTSDELFKIANYSAEAQALSFRKAIGEGLDGEALARRVQELLNNLPEDMHTRATQFAKYNTFNLELPPGGIGKSIQNFSNSHPIVRMIFPFIRTPIDIFKYTFERTPLGFVQAQLNAEIARGGAAKQLALARASLGSMVMATAVALVASGKLTGSGPDNPSAKKMWLASGRRPWSVKIGDEYISYVRLDPVGGLLGMAARFGELVGSAHVHVEPEEIDELALALVLSMSDVVFSKTFVTSFADTIEAIEKPTSVGRQYFERQIASLVPTGVGHVAKIQDPVRRQVHGMLDAIQARIPGWSKSLPPQLNIWGEPVLYDPGIGPDIASPFYASKLKNDPVEEEIIKQEVPLSMPKPVIFGSQPPQSPLAEEGPVHGVPLDPWQYNRLIELAGKEIEIGGHNLHEYYEELFKTDAYQQATEGRYGLRAQMIREIYKELFVSAARQQLLQEYPDLQEKVQQKAMERVEALSGTLGF